MHGVPAQHQHLPCVQRMHELVRSDVLHHRRLSQSTGVLAKFGYTPGSGGTAHRFPIAIGAA